MPSRDFSWGVGRWKSIDFDQFPIKNLSPTQEMTDPFGALDLQAIAADKVAKWLEACLQEIFHGYWSDDALIDEDCVDDPVEQEIRSYAELKKNWDGHDATRISPSAIKHVLAFLRAHTHLTEVAEPFPDTNGNVGLEARSGSKVLYLSFAPSGEIAYLVRDGQAVDRGRGADSAKISNVLEAIF